ncbi:MAG: ECF transporter S component [Candidatus Kerfeldbacteria bacterium]
MEKAQVQAKPAVLGKEAIRAIIQFAALVGIATLAPMIGNQFITGPIVNAVLFIATAILGVRWGIMVGLIPSVIALSVGLLPAPLAPMIPFIMISNAIMVVIFGYLRERNFWLGMISASAVKFLFLFLTSSVVTGLLLKSELAPTVAQILSWPQLATALGGGILAWAFLKAIKRI